MVKHVCWWSNLTLMWAHLPLFGTLIWPWAMWPLTYVTFDIDPKDHLPPSHMSNPLCGIHENHVVFWHGVLDLWTMTLTFKHDLDIINVHHHAKFGYPNSNGCWDMNYCPVIFVQSWTGGQTDRQKAMHMNPLCNCTGGLNNTCK